MIAQSSLYKPLLQSMMVFVFVSGFCSPYHESIAFIWENVIVEVLFALVWIIVDFNESFNIKENYCWWANVCELIKKPVFITCDTDFCIDFCFCPDLFWSKRRRSVTVKEFEWVQIYSLKTVFAYFALDCSLRVEEKGDVMFNLT